MNTTNDDRFTTMGVMISPVTRSRVEKAAHANGITRNEYIRRAIKEKLFLDSLGPSTHERYFTLKDKKIIKNRWKCEFADNGWLDWICPDCDTVVWNDDVHVSLSWAYCPICGNKIVEYEDTK